MRLLHTMLRVNNLEESLKFYTDLLGMQLQDRQDYPEGKFTLAFVGPMKHGKTLIAFIEDPNGYKIELIQRV